jgi:hypothetical protein
MQPPAEMVHWLFAGGILLLGLTLLAEAIVGEEVWRARPWRAYLFPGLVFGIGLLLWPVMILYTNSAIHTLAHGSWAQVMMLAGAAELGLARGKLKSQYWRLTMALALFVSGSAFLIHEANPWFFQRSAFLHHVNGWVLIAATPIAVARAIRPRSVVFGGAFALVFVVVAVVLFSDRDLAPVFGHLSPLAGAPHR